MAVTAEAHSSSARGSLSLIIYLARAGKTLSELEAPGTAVHRAPWRRCQRQAVFTLVTRGPFLDVGVKPPDGGTRPRVTQCDNHFTRCVNRRCVVTWSWNAVCARAHSRGRVNQSAHARHCVETWFTPGASRVASLCRSLPVRCVSIAEPVG